MLDFSSCGKWELLSSCGARASFCSGFSCCKAQTLGCMGLSSWGSQALEHRLNSCGTRVSLLRALWDLPGSEIKPVSPALGGESFTTEPPGKPSPCFLTFPHLYLMSSEFYHDQNRTLDFPPPALLPWQWSPTRWVEPPSPQLFKPKVEGSFSISVFPETPTFSLLKSLTDSRSRTF